MPKTQVRMGQLKTHNSTVETFSPGRDRVQLSATDYYRMSLQHSLYHLAPIVEGFFSSAATDNWVNCFFLKRLVFLRDPTIIQQYTP